MKELYKMQCCPRKFKNNILIYFSERDRLKWFENSLLLAGYKKSDDRKWYQKIGDLFKKPYNGISTCVHGTYSYTRITPEEIDNCHIDGKSPKYFFNGDNIKERIEARKTAKEEYTYEYYFEEMHNNYMRYMGDENNTNNNDNTNINMEYKEITNKKDLPKTAKELLNLAKRGLIKVTEEELDDFIFYYVPLIEREKIGGHYVTTREKARFLLDFSKKAPDTIPNNDTPLDYASDYISTKKFINKTPKPVTMVYDLPKTAEGLIKLVEDGLLHVDKEDLKRFISVLKEGEYFKLLNYFKVSSITSLAEQLLYTSYKSMVSNKPLYGKSPIADAMENYNKYRILPPVNNNRGFYASDYFPPLSFAERFPIYFDNMPPLTSTGDDNKQITIIVKNDYEGKFYGGYVQFGCAKIHLETIKIAISSIESDNEFVPCGYKAITTIKIGKGEFDLEELRFMRDKIIYEICNKVKPNI